MVDVEIIKQRKKIYGSNFEDISIKWEDYFKSIGADILVTPKDVCELMALMKECRVKKGNDILNIMVDNDANGSDIKQICESVVDSQTDRDNYRYIANNWKWYSEI